MLRFDDGQQMALKLCKNAFSSRERISGWQRLCKHYASLGIYCPQVLDSRNHNPSETIAYEGENYVVYGEELAEYTSMDDYVPKLSYDAMRPDIIKSLGIVASNATFLLPWPSVYRLYDPFDADDETDEYYERAEEFVKTIHDQLPQYDAYAQKIWTLFLQKRETFEPIYRALPHASFQSDLNPTNIQVNDEGQFVGLIDFNLSGTSCVLHTILLPDACTYRLNDAVLERINTKGFYDACDAFMYQNLAIFNQHYRFSDLERAHFCLCYNVTVPFAHYMNNHMLQYALKVNKAAYVEAILDWTYFQMSRDDLMLD